MKKVWISIALAAVVGASYAQTTTTTTTTNNQGTATTTTTTQIQPFMTQNNLGWEDAAAALAISRATGMDPTTVVTTRGTTTTPYFDLAPAYVLAQQSGKSFNDIMQMYNNGQTWMQIARSLNVSPTYWNPSNADTATWTNQDFANAVWQNILQNQYGMTPEDYTYFHTQNYPLNEVVVADVYSRELNRPVRDVYTSYTTASNTWSNVAAAMQNNGGNSAGTVNNNNAANGYSSSGTSSNSSSSYQRTETTQTTTTPTTTQTTPNTNQYQSQTTEHHTQTVFAPDQNNQSGSYNSSTSTYAQRSTTTSRHAMRKRRHRRTRRTSRRPCR